MSKQNKIFSIDTSIVNNAILCVMNYETSGFFTEVTNGRGVSSSVSDLLA